MLSILVAVVGYLFKRVDTVESRIAAQLATRDHEVWQAVDKLRDEYRVDRAAAASDRTRIAENMVTRDEFNRQVGRLERAIYYSKGAARHPSTDEG